MPEKYGAAGMSFEADISKDAMLFQLQKSSACLCISERRDTSVRTLRGTSFQAENPVQNPPLPYANYIISMLGDLRLLDSERYT